MTGTTLEKKLDQSRVPTARALEEAATRVRENWDAGAAKALASRMEIAGHYLRQHQVREMLRDINDVVRRYPMQALAASAAAGLVIGSVLWRRR